MSDFQQVKQNMLNASISISELVSVSKGLVSSLNNVNVDNAPRVLEGCIKMVELMNVSIYDIHIMKELNKKELHLFFRDFNNESDMISKSYDVLFKSLVSVIREVASKYYVYMVTDDVLGERINIELPKFNVDVGGVVKSIGQIERFNHSLKIHNDKLQLGNR